MAAFNPENIGFSSDDDDDDTSDNNNNNNNKITSGYPFQLVDEALEEKFTCVICGEIIKTFLEIPCNKGHGGCKYCVEKWEENKYK